MMDLDSGTFSKARLHREFADESTRRGMLPDLGIAQPGQEPKVPPLLGRMQLILQSAARLLLAGLGAWAGVGTKWEWAPGPANSPQHPPCPGLGLGLGQPARHKQTHGGSRGGTPEPVQGLLCSAGKEGFGLLHCPCLLWDQRYFGGECREKGEILGFPHLWVGFSLACRGWVFLKPLTEIRFLTFFPFLSLIYFQPFVVCFSRGSVPGGVQPGWGSAWEQLRRGWAVPLEKAEDIVWDQLFFQRWMASGGSRLLGMVGSELWGDGSEHRSILLRAAAEGWMCRGWLQAGHMSCPPALLPKAAVMGSSGHRSGHGQHGLGTAGGWDKGTGAFS
ncbi:uncharacterized protein LOC128820681 [Vidua macroura]|uniref:uncharacterized protein LOC128820681 n=1 Tax=Vidua macroura TaxID=187451 RepID=UPI0023A86FFB|nr:uncharacterized protein LOC128820681 [Vidua macroura]XP_053857471.1 uncharacterized protein LOC128820681 [Vidua macroura]XP_053857472.1 uncharacterized protein LOC128820681 [Vidua macroura]